MSVNATAMQTIAPELEILLPLEREGTVNLIEIGRMALDSLFANLVRSLLTMLGVIIGVASVVALLALGNGATKSITAQVQSIGTNLLTVINGTQTNQQPGQAAPAQNLTLGDSNAIVALNLPVLGVSPQFGTNAQLVAPASDKSAQVVGTTPAYQTLNTLTLSSGRFIDDSDVKGAAAVIVLGATVKDALFGKGEAVGQSIRANDQTLRVIGVLVAKGGSGFGSVDDRAVVPISFAHQHFPNARTPDGNNYLVTNITVSVTDSKDVDGVSARISALLRERHRLKPDGTADDFNMLNQASFLTALTTITNLLTVFLAAVAGISLLVGGIGIMNIMLVSVTERTREIGLRKAIGARPQDILIQFILEAIAISLTGGLIGLALGASIALLVTVSGVLTASVDASSVALALGFSMAVGLFFGIYPAQRAARLNPIDALRFE